MRFTFVVGTLIMPTAMGLANDRLPLHQQQHSPASLASTAPQIPTTPLSTLRSCLLDRRTLVTGLVAAATGVATLTSRSPRAVAQEEVIAAAPIEAVASSTTSSSSSSSSTVVSADELQDVYFGVGCFWHIQHEFVQAERERLGRSDSELTSMAGYAGGTAAGAGGKVCYHNMQMVADYGRLGHGEVVGMKIPVSEIVPFTEYYFSLFNPRTKDRVDPMDRGGEYRSLLGLPGGTEHAMYPAMQDVAKQAGFTLVPGKGNDPDTLGKQTVFVYDTTSFPFYQAEIYHQYHNDFQSPAYGKAYNNLANVAYADGRLKPTGCPDRI